MKYNEMIDAIIVDCNNLAKHLISGEYIGFCSLITQIVQKMIQLRETVKKELDNKDKIIDELKRGAANGTD